MAKNNRLASEFPVDMSKLKNLHSLNLSGDSISGVIPLKIFGTFSALTILNLFSHDQLTSVVLLNMSSNQLTSVVLLLLQSMTFDRSFLGNRLYARLGSGTKQLACTSGRQELSKGLVILFAMLVLVALSSSRGCSFATGRTTDTSVTLPTERLHISPLLTSLSPTCSSTSKKTMNGSSRLDKVSSIHLASYGTVAATNKIVVMKKICNMTRVDTKLDKQFEVEVMVLGNMWHNNIVKILDCISCQEA
uniref:Protein kinase domain-containing protein n=1 Tax=Leersia perrieri TaxID=77586 RepID=A0A0D9X5N3_9ORYZ